ncbi:hypothetical protein GDO81_009908 [Engystomops pustulosus]|uniref:Uncharacterized protein n=1 Tax=Engystomops pustulosus TaxID=76066 RepID=A0AAV7BWC5_ENGPU|nr:hypothetical protein GDO81_009908 [Engystomops pustulosus]
MALMNMISQKSILTSPDIPNVVKNPHSEFFNGFTHVVQRTWGGGKIYHPHYPTVDEFSVMVCDARPHTGKGFTLIDVFTSLTFTTSVVFEEDLTPNGFVCETCYNNGGNEYCESEETIECTGNQDRCFDYCVILQNPDCSVLEYCTKGCTNTFTCENSFDCNIGLKEVRRKHLAC